MNSRIRILSSLLALVLAPALSAPAATSAAPAPDPATGIIFAKPERIRYDNRSLIIDGKPVFIYSGALHYFRCPPELWRDRLQKMKDAGLNCVETYVAWRVHEPEEPSRPGDYSKLRDMEQIGSFIQTARDLGLHVIIRPGPYICAEVDRGGFPGWLMKYRPADARPGYFLRGDYPVMHEWSHHWLAAVAKIVRPHLVTNLPEGAHGVILWQLENEYDWGNPILPSGIRTAVLRAHAQIALDCGIDVPLFTCETTAAAFRNDPFLRSRLFNAANSYPNFNMRGLISTLRHAADYQPELFQGVTELQGGWYARVNDALSDQKGHNPAHITQLTLTAIERGCTLLNYYMFYGGANLGASGISVLTQSYDYNAPLREWGERGDRYHAVKSIGQMLAQHGVQIINSRLVDLEIEGGHPDVSINMRRSSDGSRFYFVRNGQRNEPRSGSVTVREKNAAQTDSPQTLRYDLGNYGSKILHVPANAKKLSDGKWLPAPAGTPASLTAAEMPAAVPVRVTAITRAAPAGDWTPAPVGKHLEAANIFEQRHVHYRATFELTDDDLKTPPSLLVRAEGGPGALPARINGAEVLGTKDGFIPLGRHAREGSNTVEILFDNLGCAHARKNVEDQQGITHIALVPASTKKREFEQWRMKRLGAGEALSETPDEAGGNFNDKGWPLVKLGSPEATLPEKVRAIYRATLPVSKAQLVEGMVITFSDVADEGTLFINGKKAAFASYGSRSWTFDITAHLREGDNTLAMLVRTVPQQKNGGLGKDCTLEPAGRVLDNVQVAAAAKPAAPLAPGEATRMLVNYTLEFQIPRTPETLSVPWSLRLEADFDGFVTLNGRLLGRYWAVGRQRDIWLPECWLNFGAGTNNVMEIQARASKDAPADRLIKRVEARPYSIAVRLADR